MTPYRLVHALEIARSSLPVTIALDAALAHTFRLPSFARDYAVHEAGAGLAHLLRPLQGKFAVTNPPVIVPLPALVRARLRATAGDTPPARLALYEPSVPMVRHETPGAVPSTMPGRDIVFRAELPYRLVVAWDAARALDAETSADAAAGARAGKADDRPIAWFNVPLLVPDAAALRQMMPPTRHFYRYVTGRVGSGSFDCYWYRESWERFHEEGQVIGYVSPRLVEHGHTGGVRAATAPYPPPSDTFSGTSAPTGAKYTSSFERRGFVPPGYCLIHYAATIEVIAAGTATRGAAA